MVMVCFQENCFYGGLHKLLSLENNTNQEEEINNLYEVIFKRFDKDVKGFIDRMEFESLIRELMLAMARGIGDLPVLVALEEHSLLMKAVQHEVASLKEENCFYGGLHKLLSLENNTNQEEEINNLYEVIFKRFDKDVKGFIDRMEFESLIRELMLAMARGIGDLPVLVALEEHSLLMKAVQHEVASLKEGSRKNKRKREKNVLRDICLCCHKLETS
ncbi:hypothetical protein CFP56_026186 [Quercus suber]|uniref:EF-hand domain-containing protein n=1 Tax=Quercus suber TaxID=58331 RepID=A0AAW0K1T4_QUESU